MLLAGLFAAGLPVASQIHLGATITLESSSKKLAKALAQQVRAVRKSFGENRRALQGVQGTGGKRAFPRHEVAGLIDRTQEDLGQAIEQVGEPGLEALRAWSEEELRRIREEAVATPGQSARLPLLSTPYAVAVVAHLGGLPKTAAERSPAGPSQETLSAERSDRLLDQVAEVIDRILFLAERNDLEVRLWVGSTPAPRATFRFWSQGRIAGTAPSPTIIQANGKRERILRGLYSYRAAWTKGPVTELVEYPSSTGAQANRSEQLDLVNGSSFFCCRFNEQYCHHVDDEKECRP